MQFKNPEILYFLFFLIIPILVHLFQLRKFKKVPFTNVAFLQNIIIKNRKSSQIKKWLILCTRLLLITAVVLAFAQPFFSNTTVENNNHIAIYLDNSLSMNTKGSKGNLLKVNSQEIAESINPEYTYSLLTNATVFQNISGQELKEQLLSIKNSTQKLSTNDLQIQLSNIKGATENIIISDFQNVTASLLSNPNTPTTLIQTLPEKKDNLAIDSVYTNDSTNNKITVSVTIKNQGEAKNNVPIAIYNDKKLISKQTFSIEANASYVATFSTEKTNSFLGKIKIDYNDTFDFDNQFFFTINTNDKINVLAIGEVSDFLSRIYTDNDFNFIQNTVQNTNYNAIEQQQLIILNEIDNIPQSLITSLVDYTKKGGDIIIIPNEQSNINSYNTLFRSLSLGKINSVRKDSLKITTINFNHPLLKNVFDKRVTNFQYPSTSMHYETSLVNNSTIVSFENNTPMVSQIKTSDAKIFWFATPLSKKHSNFTNSPLVVPIFYNMGQQSLEVSKLYYLLAEKNSIEMNMQLRKDDILTIKNSDFSFIPLQQTYQTKVKLTTEDLPNIDGFYDIMNKNDFIQSIAFNNPKNESSLHYLDTKNINQEHQNISLQNSVQDGLKKIDSKNKVHWLWKWFLLLAIVSLLLEILILKYFKV
ncbi:BatA domain-containing protein [Tenacibaculum agarivorans]|uniref:BatA domain-containing protein n=1 Tax=Tenacibaculum agarivorans TaxID=1908389 RepID=UPI00094BB39F|nr:BatA domain-containing protein [Tenacibaculum agarivorans]